MSQLCALCLLCITACSMAQDAPAPASMDAFPLGVYVPWERVAALAERNGLEKWEYVERCLDDMKAHNVDAIWAVNLGIDDLGPLAERLDARGMKLVPALAALHYNVPWRKNNWEYLGKQAQMALEAVGDSQSILGWALCDEPRKSFVEEMETYRLKFAEWGAKQPGLVVTMWHDTPTYATETGFPVVCPDIYPFFSTGNPNGPNTPASSRNWGRRQLTMATHLARDEGRIPWVMPQSYLDVWGPWQYDETGDVVILPGGILHWRVPTVGETRWQVWSAIGAGMRGFFWFCYLPSPDGNPDAKPHEGNTFPDSMKVAKDTPLHFPGALVRPDGSATEQYEAVAEAFAQMRPLMPHLKGTVPLDESIARAEAPGWAGTLRSGDGQRTLVVVVNDDTDAAQTIEVTVEGAVALRDLLTGRDLACNAEGKVSVELAAGGGTVLLAGE